MSKFKRWRAPLAVVAACAAAGGGTAYAASQLYFDGYMTAGGEAFSTYGNLASSEGLSVYGSTICMAATFTNGSQDGSVLCTTSSSGVGKPYYGNYRAAYCRPAVGHAVTAKCRAVWS